MAVAPARPRTQALVVPDAAHWAAGGVDLAERGIEPTWTPASADRLVVSAALPPQLAEAVREAALRLGRPDAVSVVEEVVVPGEPTHGQLSSSPGDDGTTAPKRAAAERESGHGGHGADAQGDGPDAHGDHHRDEREHGETPDHGGSHEHEAAHDHGEHRDSHSPHHRGGHDEPEHGRATAHAEGHDAHAHGDAHDPHAMMVVSGAPGRDGLVMEDIETVLGPLAPSLPTGLLVRTKLGGDVVAAAEVETSLVAPTNGTPDPLARAAWAWARARAAEGASLSPPLVARHLAATEVERALSHLMWLARLARLLGWLELADECERGARPLIGVHRALSIDAAEVDPEELARTAMNDVVGLLGRPGALRRRTRGLAWVSEGEARDRGLRGPLARASGLEADVRSLDPAYGALGFEPQLREEGDAEARTRLRAEEAAAAVRLARAALEARELPADEDRAVEGPRGPLVVARDGSEGEVRAPGSAAARGLAGELALGLELAAGLVVIASFDLSPWAVHG